MMQGISHITFVVQELQKAKFFFETVFRAREVYDSGDQTFSISREKFFLVGDLWIAIMEGEKPKERTYGHIAFHIREDEWDEYERRVRDAGVEIRPPRSRVEGEGRSLYFYDFDNHLFELHTGTLAERLERYGKRL